MNLQEQAFVSGRSAHACCYGTVWLAIAVFCLMLVPGVSVAQTGSAIQGVAQDATGGVLPGVTVEVTSPAMIEGTRVAVTDGQGIYRVVNLVPGTYSVTFALGGFGTYVRDGIVLNSSFTATVDGVLTVGGIAETITVTGEAPIVDTQNVAAVEVLTRDTIEQLPIGRTTGVWSALIPAIRPKKTSTAAGGVDVGGTQSERNQAQITVHGGPDDIQVISGGMEAMRGVYSMNRIDTQEVSIQMGGNTAEAETGGVRINIVPREGGNSFSGTFEIDGITESLSGTNIDDGLRARGMTGTPTVKKAYNFGGGVGGPIVQDKVWFFGSYRKWGSQMHLPGRYYNATQGTHLYTKDLSRPAASNDYYQSTTARVTWAATDKQKFNFSYEHADNCNCLIRLVSQNRAPEAVGNHFYAVRVPQVTWQYVASNQLLIEAGGAYYNGTGDSARVDGVGENDIAMRELTTNFRWNARADNIGGSGAYADRAMRRNVNERVNVSYVTGSHNFKMGARLQQWPTFAQYSVNGSMRQEFRNGVPNRVILYASPLRIESVGNNIGLYAQDQWRINRLTINAGVRFDYYSGYAPETTMPAGRYVPERNFAKTGTLTSLKDIDPRLGVAYDVFGDGRTALKGFVGRFVQAMNGSIPNEPATRTVNNAKRSWNDANGDFIPQESELGKLSNSAFGTLKPVADNVDEAVAFGWGNRRYNWQGIVSLDHEFVPGLGMQVAYYRTWHGNQTYKENTLVTAADFDPYCATAPTDPRLPSGVSGSQICGLYDISPEAYGKSNTYTRLAGDGMKLMFNGIDVNMTGRLGDRGYLAGGFAIGNTLVDNCGVAVDSPQALRFCSNTFGYADDIQFKLNGSYSLPWDLQAAFVFQSLPGAPVGANYLVTNAMASSTLGRNFAEGKKGSDSIALFNANTMFEERTNNLDLRASKRISVGGVTFTGNLDIANALNANTVQNVISQYGSRWLDVTNALSARMFRLGLQVGF
jgi:hypothetical protein